MANGNQTLARFMSCLWNSSMWACSLLQNKRILVSKVDRHCVLSLHKIHSNASSIEGYFSQSFTTFGPASKHASYLVWIFPRKKSESSRSKAQLPSTYPLKEVVQVHIKALLAGNKGQAFPGFSLRDIPWKAFHCKKTRLWRTWRGRLNHYKGCQKETWMFHVDSCQTAPSVIKK